MPPNPDCDLAPAFAFPNERDPAVPFVLEPPLKKRCELGLAPRIADGFAARPDGLKLSRDGVTGILPVITLALTERRFTDARLMPGHGAASEFIAGHRRDAAAHARVRHRLIDV